MSSWMQIPRCSAPLDERGACAEVSPAISAFGGDSRGLGMCRSTGLRQVDSGAGMTNMELAGSDL